MSALCLFFLFKFFDMEVHFNNSYLEKLYTGLPVSGKPRYKDEVIEKFRKRVVLLVNVENSAQLRTFKGLNFEALKGDKKGLYSIRVDLKYRLEFSIEKDKIMLREIILIEHLSNHYK
jgi:proteic killer suppression protein